ncbi:hypothetical protein GCM10010967_35800 [Dyadobacter beijingensis]|uniref:Outer membrane protein beta-barrel domain-containing protein n=1 Tax=Dyadobacter beijingensis TaxID=365489 RepID=A0ABQ2I5B8_9BACT|nr:hypothetical protein GCM10010967_35800 [Dyadobacter beijingensis]
MCQTDSVFLNQNPEPILGKVLINYKKGKVNVKGRDSSPAAFPFTEIRKIGLANGAVYLNENLKSESHLLLLLVEGKFSLLFNENDKLFYVRRNDSLLVISQAHYKRALPLIFGKELTDAYYVTSNIGAEYTAKYLKRLTSYANSAGNSPQTIYTKTIDQFKVRASIGIYAGFGHNRTAFDVGEGDGVGNVVYKKTGYASGSTLPLGLSIDIAMAKRMSILVDAYGNNTSIENLNIGGFGAAEIIFPNYLIHPELYDRSLNLSELSYKTFQIDIAGSYSLMRPERSKIRPYLFGGPTIMRLRSAEMGLSTGYRETKDAPFSYVTGYVEIDRPAHMIGFNAGVGAQYDLHKRWTLRLSAKFVGGIYPKISHTKVSSRIENGTTMPDKTWNFRFNNLMGTYDQYVRNFSINGGLYFRL